MKYRFVHSSFSSKSHIHSTIRVFAKLHNFRIVFKKQLKRRKQRQENKLKFGSGPFDTDYFYFPQNLAVIMQVSRFVSGKTFY
jgi:hypothetical protein